MSTDFKQYYYLLEAKDRGLLDKTVNYLDKKEKILLICTSRRPDTSDDIPKSTKLARYIEQALAGKATLIDASKLTIYDCTGNVSTAEGNKCGVKECALKDKDKNPTGYHRCWTSFYRKDDELWKVSKALFESNAVVFFGSVRWGQANAVYQRLIERLDWIENRHTTLGESNIIKNIDAGIILTGQNWNGENVLNVQKQVLKFYGFNVPEALSWNWQYTKDKYDESQKSYKASLPAFKKDFGL